MNTCAVKTWMAAMLLVAGAAGTAHGQFYQGRGGRILERDLGVYNSGGLSGRDLNSSFRFAQNVSFGRAGGGFGFMGDLGTTDYSDFVGGLGSNDLRSFRNRSQGSALAGGGVRPSDTASYAQSLTAGTRKPAGFRGTLETPSSTYSKSFEFDTRPDFTGLTGGSRSMDSRRATNGLMTDPLRDTERAATRSMGLSGGRGPLSAGDAFGSTRLSAGDRSLGDLGSGSSRRSSTPDSLSGLTGRGLQQRDMGVNPDSTAYRPRSINEARQATERARQSMRDAEKTRSTLNTDRIDTSIDTKAPNTSAAIERPATNSLQGNNSYDRLMERVDKLARPETPEGQNPATRPAQGGTPREGTDPSQPSSGMDDLRTRLQRGGSVDTSLQGGERVKPVSGFVGGSDWLARRSVTLSQTGAVLPSTERAAREAARQVAQRESMGLPSKTPGPDDPSPPDGKDPSQDASRGGLDPKILRGIREAGGIVDTFIPAQVTAKDPFVEHLKSAQAALENSQFFDADDRFAAASGIRPAELSPRVGRLHAQLGGAVFRSAAATLRGILRNRPETAAAKYSAKLLPPAERLTDVTTRLRELSGNGGQSGRDASLLLAYVGFQTGDASLQAQGLDLLEKYGNSTEADSDPRDAVLARFLREVWAPKGTEPSADGQAPLPGAQAPAPAPGETPGK